MSGQPFPMDGLLDGLICCNCGECKPNMVKRKLGGVMCEECHEGYEELERRLEEVDSLCKRWRGP
jgi:hypothetical protein